MAQYLLAVRYADRKFPPEEFRRLCADVPALDAKIRGFKGPAMLQVGALKCNVPPYVSVCGVEMGIQQYKDGKWTSIADGHNGKPIDTSTG